MHGVILGSNINQSSIGEDQFLPFFEEINKTNIPIVLHPMKAIWEELMSKEYIELNLSAGVGFIFETTRTLAHMTFKGTFEKCKNIKFILPHSGGTIPFLYPRWDMMYLSLPDSHLIKKLPYQPSHYLRKHYYDTAVSYYHSSLRCTLDFVGVDHMVFGSDLPLTKDDRSKE